MSTPSERSRAFSGLQWQRVQSLRLTLLSCTWYSSQSAVLLSEFFEKLRLEKLTIRLQFVLRPAQQLFYEVPKKADLSRLRVLEVQTNIAIMTDTLLSATNLSRLQLHCDIMDAPPRSSHTFLNVLTHLSILEELEITSSRPLSAGPVVEMKNLRSLRLVAATVILFNSLRV